MKNIEPISESQKGRSGEVIVIGLVNEDGLHWWQRRRYHLSIILFFGYSISYCFRTNLAIALVAMTNIREDNGTLLEAEFNWDLALQGHMLSAFYYGYVGSQVFGAWLASHYGPRLIMAYSVAIPALLTLLTPLAAQGGPFAMIFIRILLGIFSGGLYPSNQSIWARWAPTLEKSMLLSFSYSGSSSGTVLTLLLGGVLAEKFGWSILFYSVGILGFIWTTIWFLFARDSPEQDPKINPKECVYILENLPTPKKKVDLPWVSIFCSLAIWAHIIANFSNFWSFNILHGQLPTYLKDILNFDLATVGFLSAVPHLCESISLPLSGWLADWIISRGFLSTTIIRKLWVSVGFIGISIFLLLTLVIENAGGIVACFSLAIGFNSIVFSAILVNPIDLTREHASIIYGFSSSIACISGILGPILTGYLVQDKSLESWMIVFLIISGFSLAALIVFLIFGTAEQQSWAKEQEK